MLNDTTYKNTYEFNVTRKFLVRPNFTATIFTFCLPEVYRQGQFGKSICHKQVMKSEFRVT